MMEQTPDLHEMFGVGERAQQGWLTRAEAAWQNLRDKTDLIMHRRLRANVATLCDDVSAIIRNCNSDPDDIREEPAFPVMVEQVVSILDDYIRTAGTSSLSGVPSTKLLGALTLVNQAHTGFSNILAAMQGNDTKDFTLRTSFMSSVFRRIPTEQDRPPESPP